MQQQNTSYVGKVPNGLHYITNCNIPIIKPTRCTNFSNLFFGIKPYMFRTVPLSIIRSFFYCTHSNGLCHTVLLAACELDQDVLILRAPDVLTYLHTYLLTYLLTYLTQWSWVLLEKLTDFQLVKKFPTFNGTWRFIAFASSRHLSLSWASWIQSIAHIPLPEDPS